MSVAYGTTKYGQVDFRSGQVKSECHLCYWHVLKKVYVSPESLELLANVRWFTVQNIY